MEGRTEGLSSYRKKGCSTTDHCLKITEADSIGFAEVELTLIKLSWLQLEFLISPSLYQGILLMNIPLMPLFSPWAHCRGRGTFEAII